MNTSTSHARTRVFLSITEDTKNPLNYIRTAYFLFPSPVWSFPSPTHQIVHGKSSILQHHHHPSLLLCHPIHTMANISPGPTMPHHMWLHTGQVPLWQWPRLRLPQVPSLHSMFTWGRPAPPHNSHRFLSYHFHILHHLHLYHHPTTHVHMHLHATIPQLRPRLGKSIPAWLINFPSPLMHTPNFIS